MTADQLQAIASTHRRFAEALSSGEHEALPQFFTAGTLLLPSGKPLVRGQVDVVAFWTAATGDPQRRLHSVFSTEDWLVEGEVVIESGRAEISVVEAGEVRAVNHGKYLVVWKQDRGRWRIDRDIFNSDDPKKR